MAFNAPNSITGLLINNSNPQPDGSVSNPNIAQIGAAGTTQATAAALTAPTNLITNNTTANGVILPVGSKSQTLTVIPMLVTAAPKLYPPLGGTINFQAVNASVPVPAQRRTTMQAIDSTGLNWVTDSLTA